MSTAVTGIDVEQGEVCKVHPQPAGSPPATDDTRCAECEEFEKKKEDPLKAWIAVASVGCIAGLSALLVMTPSLFPAFSVPLVAVSLAFGYLTRINVIGQPEFAFLDACGLLHQHRTMPSRIDFYGDGQEDRYIADTARYEKDRHLSIMTNGQRGSVGNAFLVDGAILQLRRGGWFRRVRIAHHPRGVDSTMWRPVRCWRGLDDLVLRDYYGNELRLTPNQQQLRLQLINDRASNIAGIYHDRRTLQEERAELIASRTRERTEHHAAIAEKDAHMREMEHLLDSVLRQIVSMLAYLAHAKQTVGRSRHAVMLRKLLASALCYASEHPASRDAFIRNAYAASIQRDPANAIESAQDEATMGEDFLQELDAIAHAMERERNAAPKDAAPPATV